MTNDMPALTPSESAVALLVANAWNNAEIGAWMHLSPLTVKNHLHNVANKWDIHEGYGATRHAIAVKVLQTIGA